MTIAVVGDPKLSCGRYFKKLELAEVAHTKIQPRIATAAQLEKLHSPEYVRNTLDGWSEEWVGRRPDLAERAATSVGSCIRAVRSVSADHYRRVFVPDGGRPHASSQASDRVSVFNDVVISAEWATRRKQDVTIIDLDGLYSPALEYLTRYNPRITTVSIHDSHPEGGNVYPTLGTYNFQLDEDAGDIEFTEAIDRAREVVDSAVPDLLIVNIGSTAHEDDELTTLQVSLEGIYEGVTRICQTADEICGGRMVALGGVSSAHSEWQSTIMAAATHALSLSYLRSSARRDLPAELKTKELS